MIIKKLVNLYDDIKKISDRYKHSNNEERVKIKKEYIDTLKLYLYESNLLIKDTFITNLSPYIYEEGEASSIKTKSKDEFLNEINIIQNSYIYLSLNSEKKALVDNAFYVLINYYYND